MTAVLSVQPEPPGSADGVALIAELDTHLSGLYAPENCHGLSVAALQDKSVVFLIARLDGVAAGCGAVKFVAASAAEDRYAEVKRMYVRPAWRGQGIAQALLGHLERLSHQKGFAVLRLETGIYQPEAVGLYERMGFARCSPFGDYADDGVSLCFEKKLV